MVEQEGATQLNMASPAPGRRTSGFLTIGALAGLAVLIGALCATVARHGVHLDQEMALFPWLMRNGWALYTDVRDQHGPLFPALLALLPDPGSASTQLAVTIVLVGLVAALVAVGAWRVAGPVAALLATGLYALWILSYDGAHLWYDLALAPVYLLAFILGLSMVRGPGVPWKALALGLLLSVAILVKQQAVVAVLGVPALIPVRQLRLLGLFLLGISLPVLASLLVFLGMGGLGDYLYWTVGYNITSNYAQEGSTPVPATDWPILLALFAPAAALALSAAWLPIPRRDAGRMAIFTGGLLVAATIPVWPRYATFHLAAAVPLLAMLGGIGIWTLVGRFPGLRMLALVPWALAVLLVLFSLRVTGPSGERTLANVWRTEPAPLPYSATAGPLRSWIQAQTPPDRPILVYDLDSTLYRVVERKPPKPWSPLYPWILEGDSTSAQWLAGIEQAQPRIVLVTPEFVAGRHLPLPDGGRSEAYLRAHYKEAARFTVQKYPDSGPQQVVALQLSAP
jgi:hypothetical protein